MTNGGVRRPALNAAICLAIAACGAVAVAWGALGMTALGHETPAMSGAVGLGILAFLFGSLFFLNFLWAARIVKAMRRGDNVIARWTVAPATFELFRDLENRLTSQGSANDYRPPRRTPPLGLEVIFSVDGVLVGDTFFGLASTGISRFGEVRRRSTSPACLEFGTVLTSATNLSRLRIHHTEGVLRIPIGHAAGAAPARVLSHFQDVIARKTIVKPHFWRTRIRISLGTAVVASIVAGLGVFLAPMNSELGDVPLIMAVAGTVFGIGGLVLALLAWRLHERQHGR